MEKDWYVILEDIEDGQDPKDFWKDEEKRLFEKGKIPEAWRGGRGRAGLIPRKVQVEPKTGRPYLAIRWTTGLRRGQLGELEDKLRGVIDLIGNIEVKRYMKKYIRGWYGQMKGEPHMPKLPVDEVDKLFEYRGKVDDIFQGAGGIKPPSLMKLRPGRIRRAAVRRDWKKPNAQTSERKKAALQILKEQAGQLEKPNLATEIKPFGQQIESEKIAEYLRKKIAEGKTYTWETAMSRVKEVFPGQSEGKYERALGKVFGLKKPSTPLPVRAKLPEQELATIKGVTGARLKKYFQDGTVTKLLKIKRRGELQEEEKEEIGGAIKGTNETYRMWIKDDGDGCWKPEFGENKGGRSRALDCRKKGGELFRREAATYSIAKVLEMEDLVPETYIRNDDSHGPGSLQAWVYRSDQHEAQISKNRYPEDLIRTGFLDFICENMDRHGNNYFITDGGKLQLIDNGYAFGNLSHWSWDQNTDSLDWSGSEEIPKYILSKAVETKDEAVSVLKKLGLDEKAIQYYEERVKLISKSLESGEKVSVKMLVDRWRRG